MLFDTHAHYDAEQFDGDREAVLAGLVRRGVSLAVNPGCDVPSSRAAVALARVWPFLYAAVGYHPENCAPYDPAELDLFREWAKDPRVVAIGEIGLDYYWEENPPREHQRRVFRDQMALAEELGLPVIVHDREAQPDQLLRHLRAAGIPPGPGGVPLLFRQRGDGGGAGQAGLDGLLYRRADL